MSKYISLDNLTRYDSKIKELAVTQMDTMPEPSASTVGKIVQFVGATTVDYTQGYFYKGISETTEEGGEEVTTYSWEQINVQDGASYTAGTNINIDSNNAINCDIPYKGFNQNSSSLAQIFGFVQNSQNVNANNFKKSIIIGGSGSLKMGFGGVQNAIAIGNEANAQDNSIIIGNNTSNQLGNTIVIGNYARATKGNQAMLGSSTLNINEMAMYTSSGVKVVATEDYAIQKAYELAGLTAYSSSSTYAVDDYVYYNLLIYKCNTAVSTAEDFDSNKWTQKTYEEYLMDTLTFGPEVITSSASTYTIASLTGNKSYKLGEITSLTISATTTFDTETIIYFDSGTTATSISMPDSITNIGDVPTMTTASGVNTGTCEASKSYIISVLNNIAIWRAY